MDDSYSIVAQATWLSINSHFGIRKQFTTLKKDIHNGIHTRLKKGYACGVAK
jgi:hypothetical protein